MADNKDRNLNVTIKNEAEDKDEIAISLSSIFRKLKKYFLPWLIVAALVCVIILSVSVIANTASKPALKSLISFTYDGIEKGLDPNGNTFDVNTIKSPAVIEDALTELGMELDLTESIRQGISIQGIIPNDAIDRLTAYKSIYENGQTGNIQAAQAMLETTYYPTQYTVTFDYANTGLTKSKAVEVNNMILEKYNDYFYDKYGYNEALGASVTAINYQDYDYSEAIDLFSSTLNTLSSYLKQLSAEDETRFRSSTGYTFDDLYQAVNTVKSIDLDMISSKVTVNNLTRDKNETLNYYTYRIEELERQKAQYTESLNSVIESIGGYQKDTLLVMQSSDGQNTEISQTSKEYDNLIERKVSISNDLAKVNHDISFYTARKEKLEKGPAGSEEMAEGVEEDFQNLNTKVQSLVDVIRSSSDEYYREVRLSNSYNILVPAVNSASATVVSIIKDSIKGILVAEAIIFVIYFGYAFLAALVSENKKKPAVSAVSANDTDEPSGDDDNDAAEEKYPEENEEAPKSEAKKSGNNNNSKKKK